MRLAYLIQHQQLSEKQKEDQQRTLAKLNKIRVSKKQTKKSEEEKKTAADGDAEEEPKCSELPVNNHNKNGNGQLNHRD